MEQTPSIATPAASPSNSEAALADAPLKDSLDVQSGSATPSGTTMTSPPISPIPNATNDSNLASPQPALALPKTHGDTSPEASSDYYSGSGGDSSQDDSDTVAHHQQISALSSPSMGAQALDDNNPHAGYTPESDADAVPTLEQLGLHNLSSADLAMMLQQAYEMIQEKERDINMAAMMGQNLVETNNVLQAKYQHLLTQLRHQKMHRPRHLTPPRKIALGSSSDPAHIRAVGDDGEGDADWVDFEPPQSSSLASSSHYSSYRRSAGHSGGISRSRQDIEKLATLEEQNAQLQVKIDTITKELKQGRRQAFKHHRKAEKELKAVREELHQSSVKVGDLEAQNGRLIEASRQIRLRRITLKNQLPAPGSIPGTTMAAIAMEMEGDEMTIQEMLAEDNRIFEELRDRLHSLERKNTNLQHQKVEADKRAQQYAQDLAATQQQREELLAKLCELSELQDAYNEQSEHVRELESQVEELRDTVGTMSARFSQMNSPLMSPTSPVHSSYRRDDLDVKAIKTILQGPASPSPLLKSPSLSASPLSPGLSAVPRSPGMSPRMRGVPRSPGMNAVPRSPGMKGVPRSPRVKASPAVKPQRPRMTLLAELENEFLRNFSFFGPPRPEQQPLPQEPIHINGLRSPKSPKVLKDHRHDSGAESEAFSDDAGGRVKGWRKSIRSMDEESVCESSSCVRKKQVRRHRYKYEASDTDGDHIDESHGEDSDVERYQLLPRNRNPQACTSSCGEETDDMSDCSDPHHLHFSRPETPGCCCHLYDDYSDGEYSYDEEDDNDSVAGWTHFMDHDASIFGYDIKLHGHYAGRKQRRGLFGLIQGVFMLFRFFWRWCRFIAILSTALGIALYRGPDALLTDGQ
ncbi:hypothetical protein BGX34_004636 [Mortierella sp. NVP85]|nr:hypothetical protein BGX34_004636 [Mortierella sp. NVP85]